MIDLGQAPQLTSGNSPSKAPFHVMAKPIGPICNLDCEYCFYLKKEELFPGTKSFRMTDEVLERFTRQYIAAQPAGTSEVNFAWQGGEPTLMGVKFFRRAIELQEQYRRPGLRITNSLQTNGVLLDDEWGTFLHDHNFLVGISLDGPEALHDRYRLDKQGRGTFQSVMAGLEVLRKNDVKFNTLTVIQNDNGDHPEVIYDFLKQVGSRFYQFIPIVEKENDGQVSYRSVGAEQYGHFLNGIFDCWLEQKDEGQIFVRDFDMMLGLVMGEPSSVCVHAETCGRAVAIEHNGDLFSCDHFVNLEDQLGNVARETLSTMLDGSKQERFGNDKRDSLPRYCRECEFLEYCYGACPKDRFSTTPDGEPGLNVLCAGYKLFYGHTLPVWEKMAKCLRLKRPVSDYQAIETLLLADLKAQGNLVGRNDPCPCGSGRKFKKCCNVAGEH
ncbi:MAG: anaerobic sulfatase maturase [Candidatus Marinimicrobia bacterium]|nr:anaerobic sulfatase maturase [Candidatus Neomarinimicrobiota bacterium]